MSKIKRTFLFMSIYLTLLHVDYLLKKHGFEYIFDKYTTKYSLENKKTVDETSLQVINQVVKLINTVCRFYPLEAECIQRSLLSYKYIRRVADIEVDMVVGVKKHPFESHAWIELNGMSLTEPEDAIKDFMIILTSKGGIPQ
ncbi:lasso peptide biosynthesis B2 protein [Lederbergia sp. NSJ-179]|uniref:lasso peptide biosynthesis B2 protein n=1 Tax=Lederbergia sp. NSJ-179 TaxID=2931402 RepID=UPI001FD1FF00|nr:lasso peptide biosynthesis B2 protein [Lederbergia sp. NSJ-179]MCJ7841917.1 lasso peptide biosynthesis B2 protein [Lederbergia sp. NSJ-179]